MFQLFWLLGLLLVIILRRIERYWNARKTVTGVPIRNSLFGTLTTIGYLGPTTWWNPGVNFPWRWRNKIYDGHNSDIISIAPMLFGKPAVYTRSLAAVEQIIKPIYQRYEKPGTIKRVLRLCGDNLLSTDGSEWKKHRRVVAPAFTQKTYELVWSETRRIYNELVEAEGWNRSIDDIEVPIVSRITLKVGLSAIASAGFGLPFSWSDPPHAEGMSIQEAFAIFAETTQLRVLLPSWMFKLPIRSLKRIESANRMIKSFVGSTIDEKKRQFHSGASFDSEKKCSSDLFTRLIKANEEETHAERRLSDYELHGSVFALLFAGHETTAHAMAATLGLLALYEDEQEIAYRSICEAAPLASDLNIGHFDRLEQVQACVMEAIRLFPSGSILSRQTTEDVVLQIPSTSRSDVLGQCDHVTVKRGTQVIVDMIGLNYHPAYFSDPEEYRPSRWHKGGSNESSDIPFMSFSVGPRACVGRKFAMTEAVCFISHLLREFQVLPGGMEEGMTKNEWRGKYLQAVKEIVLRPTDFPIVLRRRL